jgi:hypothetical protein
MKLSADQFEQILGSLRSFKASGDNNDKRRSPRVGLRMNATLIACNTGHAAQPHTVRVRDVSAEGIGLTHVEALAAGSYFIVAFRRSAGEVLSVLYRVAHCHRMSDRAFAVGGMLERVLSSEELKSSRRTA